MGSSPLSAIRRRMECAGGDERAVDVLRRALAATEDGRTLRALAVALEEFRDYVAEDFLGAVADLRDRLHAKMFALDAGSSPTPRRICTSPSRDGGHVASPAIKMRLSDWAVDEFGVRGRVLWNASDGPVPP
jgi:hypothetical protein